MSIHTKLANTTKTDLEVFIHDLATPITNIDLNLNLLQNQITPKHKYADITLSRALSSLSQLNGIIAQKRNYLYTQGIREYINIYKEILSIKTSHFPLLEKYSISLEINSPQEILLYTNKYKFRQVVDNLINNSIDALSLTKRKKKVIHLSIINNTESIILTIYDNGDGINQKLIQKVFDLNFSTKTNHSGIGLWLIKQTITTEFGGQIELKSKPSKYTEITLTLPKKSNSK